MMRKSWILGGLVSLSVLWPTDASTCGLAAGEQVAPPLELSCDRGYFFNQDAPEGTFDSGTLDCLGAATNC